MPYTGWLCYSGIPILDACRTVAFGRNAATGAACLDCLNNGGCGCCGPLHADEVYTDVAGTGGGTPAPWYDPSAPESEGFFGLLATSITGLEPGETTRAVVERADGRGGLLGRQTQQAAIITVRALVMASDCCSADFGLRWLGSELRDVCDQCEDNHLTFYTCCPGECEDTPGGGGGENSCDRFRRNMHGVSMISSPKIIDESLADPDSECGCIYEIEFQFAAANPCQYGEHVELSTAAFIADTSDDCRFEWYSPSECADAGCQPEDPCFADPGCLPAALPPQPSSPLVCGACAPWEIATACVDTVPDIVPLHADGVPTVTLFSGSAPLRSTTVHFYANPLDSSPGELLADECASCSELTITRIPPNSTLVIDGVHQKITLSCEGGTPVNASRLVAAGGGALPFVWPTLPCAGQIWTICAVTDGDVVAPDATMGVSITAMECG